METRLIQDAVCDHGLPPKMCSACRPKPAAPPEDKDAELASLRETISKLQRKLALIFDQSCYSDSLGVEGSSFLTCRWCGGGSGPGGKPAFSHNKGCLLDNDELEKEVASVWEEIPELNKEITELEATIFTQQEDLKLLAEKVVMERVDSNALRAENEELRELLSDAISMVASGFHKRRLNLKLISLAPKPVASDQPAKEAQ